MTITEPDENVQNVSGLNQLYQIGHVVVVSADFDFTLLYKLIRNLLTAIPPPTCGWGNKPLPGHLNETDDIERIRYLRNYLSHNPNSPTDIVSKL
jgi:hypothetical protein